MRFVFIILTGLALLGLSIAAVGEVFVVLSRIFTGHPFKALGSLILVAIFAVIAWAFSLILKALLDREPVS